MESVDRPLGKLFLVSTPIGNLGDITLRAIETLKDVDFLVVEDTRVALKLLSHLKIRKPMLSYFRHARATKADLILERLQRGENAALLSDAGMPCISDPGEELVCACIDIGVLVIPIPGANAALSAIIASGLQTSRFCFEGFLPMNKKNRQERLKILASEQRTIILYEAPHKLLQTLKDIMKVLGNRRICLARELTKNFEEFRRTELARAVEYYETATPKGEFVLVIEGCEQENIKEFREEDVLAQAKVLRDAGKSQLEISKILAKTHEVSKNKIYRLLIAKMAEKDS